MAVASKRFLARDPIACNGPKSMFLIAAFSFAILAILLAPLADGLLDTSRWATKVLESPGKSDESPGELAPLDRLANNAALLEGWLSNIPFLQSILSIGAVVIGFLYSWWGGILVFAVIGFFSGFSKIIMTRPLSYYLTLIYIKMLNRAADYRRKNDNVRANAADSFCSDLQHLIALYDGSPARPPSRKQLQNMPRGEPDYLLNNPKKPFES